MAIDLPEQRVHVLRQLALELAADVARRYRIDAPRAVEVILADWHHNPALLAVVASSASARDARRTRLFRKAAATTKKMIYHRLRAYRAEPDGFDTAVAALLRLPPDATLEQVAGAALAVA